MDAKRHNLALLAALSLFCAAVALISDHLVLGLVFFVLGGRCHRDSLGPMELTEDRTPTHGYAPTREAAMAAFAKSWRRQ